MESPKEAKFLRLSSNRLSNLLLRAAMDRGAVDSLGLPSSSVGVVAAGCLPRAALEGSPDAGNAGEAREPLGRAEEMVVEAPRAEDSVGRSSRSLPTRLRAGEAIWRRVRSGID